MTEFDESQSPKPMSPASDFATPAMGALNGSREVRIRPLNASQSSGDDVAPASDGLNAAKQSRVSEAQKTALESTETLLEEHHADVFRYAYRLAGNTSAAEDISQEVFIRAFRNAHQLRDPKAARGWLLTITRNEFARWCKKFASKPLPDPNETCQETAEGGQQVVDRQEWVQQALEQLPPDYRTVVGMFYFEQLSYSEIATELSVPIGTVMSRLNRGRTHLKKALNSLAEPNNLT